MLGGDVEIATWRCALRQGDPSHPLMQDTPPAGGENADLMTPLGQFTGEIDDRRFRGAERLGGKRAAVIGPRRIGKDDACHRIPSTGDCQPSQLYRLDHESPPPYGLV